MLGRATVVVDLVEQSATVGELHHALDAGVMSLTDVHAQLGEVIAKQKPARTSDDEIIVFDATGTALQDAASAAAAYRKAVAGKEGTTFDFFSRTLS